MTDEAKRQNAVQYAEQTLGVHVPWEDAQRALASHQEHSDKSDELRRSIRGFKQAIDDRKMVIATEAPSHKDWPDGVQKQRDFTKVLYAMDENLGDLESSLDAAQADLDHSENARKHQEQVLYAVTARMNELGGLLHFYAAAKDAENRAPIYEVSVEPRPPIPPPFSV